MPKKNEIIDVKIEDIAFPNKGLGRYEDYKVVIKNSLPGESIRMRITKKKSGVLEGRIEEIFVRLRK